jgi:hypothetical protein
MRGTVAFFLIALMAGFAVVLALQHLTTSASLEFGIAAFAIVGAFLLYRTWFWQ